MKRSSIPLVNHNDEHLGVFTYKLYASKPAFEGRVYGLPISNYAQFAPML